MSSSLLFHRYWLIVIGQVYSFFCNIPALDVETKNSLFNVGLYCTVAVITVPNCGTLQILISRIIAVHGGKANENYDRFHTIRGNEVLL